MQKRFEKMTVNEKILVALKSANDNLENSMLALSERDKVTFADSIWHSAAEVEYALFLFSMILQDKSTLPKWKSGSDLETETGPVLLETQNLLKDAEKCVANERLLDAYKSAYIARHYLLKLQEDIAKKKHEAFKKK
ncbi:MAG: hypothetical protein OEZ40_06810 [Candidatus Bathyarchaeota archaeon]|nr:hypothetical protein [Candidatus Bathyarchaeota archaeon]